MAKTLTTKQLQTAFGVGHMTIYNWRAGSATRDPLPCSISDERRVTFDLAAVKAWAKKHGVAFTAPTEAAEVTKPGPKPKVVAQADVEKVKKAPAAKEQTPAVKKASPDKSSKLGRAISAHAVKTTKVKARAQAAA